MKIRLPVIIFVIVCSIALLLSKAALAQHPHMYVANEDRTAVVQKIKTQSWAKLAWDSLLKNIDPYVTRHQTDPEWIISRLAMYWKEGAHYTQCYIKKENWNYGEGNAPVPTVRLPGMRVWNDYVNVPLKDRIPFNETGDMKATSRKNPSAPVVLVPYKSSGHLIRGNNVEIVTLAENAAFAYWITGKEKYAKFASDIFYTWLIGTYYMNPPYDPSFMKSGTDAGGIFGYYDYEQIHDDLAMHAAPVYDFLYDYLNKYPDERLKAINKTVTEVASTVFKRFIDIGFIRGGKSGNWNVNGWNLMMHPILVLEHDNYYSDKKGKEYYLNYFTKESTQYHEALPDILKTYDPVTGLWPESPGYALATISMLTDMAIPVYIAGTDIIASNPIMQKAALALFPWLDARGNTVVFGDTRGGPGNFATFEKLLTYYTWKQDQTNATIAASAIQKGIAGKQYDRSKTDWTGICTNEPAIPEGIEIAAARIAYSKVHRHVVMKNGNDEKTGLMATVYGGSIGQHLSPNGLALQLYGNGWALAPDASAYESYWSADHGYHQSVTGVNTIVPGYAEGPVTINAMDPSPAINAFINDKAISPYCSFIDISANEKRRLVSMIRTSDSTGYYIDIFRSDLDSNDYLWHNIGNQLLLSDSSKRTLSLSAVNDLGTMYSKNYSYFTNQRKANYEGDLNAQWVISATNPSILMDMWMKGNKGREIYAVDAPPTTVNPSVVPAGICVSPMKTPTLIVRQNNYNAAIHPFVAVFEPYEGNQKSIKKITTLPTPDGITVLQIESNPLNDELRERKEYVIYSLTNELQQINKDISFKGLFGVVSENKKGLQYLYLGNGKLLSDGMYRIEATKGSSASLEIQNGIISYSSLDSLTITLPLIVNDNNQSIFFKKGTEFMEAKCTVDLQAKTIIGILPDGLNVVIKLMKKLHKI